MTLKSLESFSLKLYFALLRFVSKREGHIYNIVTFESKVEPKSVESSTVSVADTVNVALN